MIVVKIELWPHGDELRRQQLGTAHIINNGEGTRTVGHYTVKLFKSGRSCPGVWKAGSVRDFPRQALGPWDLLYRALDEIVGPRNVRRRT
jgi:hypothetical protein